MTDTLSLIQIQVGNENLNVSAAESTVKAEEITGVVEDMILQVYPEENNLEEYEDEDSDFDDSVITKSEDCLDFVDELPKPLPVVDNVAVARKLLLEIIGSDKASLKEAFRLMDKEDTKKRNTDKQNAKQYRYCEVLTTCSHCGVTSVRSVTLETKTDSFVYISEGNRVNIVTFQTIDKPCTFIAKTTFCGSCYDYIHNMSIYELEERYINLLKGGCK